MVFKLIFEGWERIKFEKGYMMNVVYKDNCMDEDFEVIKMYFRYVI